MSQTPAVTIPLAAKRPTAPPKPSPSRTPYRALPGTPFSAALRAAANEARLSQAQYANPSTARIGAPSDPMSAGNAGAFGVGMAGNVPGLPGMSGLPGMPGVGTQPPPGIDARLWESLTRGATFPIQPATAGAPAQMAAVGPRTEPAAQAITPAMIRERQQAFLGSIKGSDQTSVNEYENVTQARAWGYSTCSAASLTAVLRAAGQDVRIADVMNEMPGGMTIKLGLVSRPSLVNAANTFGAKATDDVTSYEALKQATENGQPVLVDIRNGTFSEGHWIVVTGVDENGVQCADSSRYNLTSIPRGEFLRSWSSRGIRLEGLAPNPSAPTAAPARTNAQSA
jgi:uncharacterized protein YvpB